MTGIKTCPLTSPSNVCWSITNKLWTSTSCPNSAAVLAPMAPGFTIDSEPMADDDVVLCVCVLALGRTGVSPAESWMSMRMVTTPNVCNTKLCWSTYHHNNYKPILHLTNTMHTCELSWYAILRGDSPSGTVRMCSFCISSIVPIVTVLSVANARLQQFCHINTPDTVAKVILFQWLPYQF